MNENTIYTWSFSEEKNRGALWYIIAISIVIGFAFWGIITQIYGLSIAIVLAAGILFYIENNSSKIVEVEITTLGISFGGVFYDFGKIDNFSFIYYKKNAIYLKIVLNKKGLKNINLRVDNKICEDLKQILPNFIKEEKDGDLTFADRLINFLKL
ncbi:hypothetical protein BKN14_04325 [Candidatus Gracilibacteria bacterium HOT-871]|nr:hypothetical protein BKN14_04325 [Candidatus Gracilibacteria bacterium HOT-871]MBB1564977.1 hypothetical protein [Candidatus Gracilibacteria bacterium]RKW22534.1 MAG: hypothetical protein D8B46_05190 [Candidatus Gracilibacteria bacterium]